MSNIKSIRLGYEPKMDICRHLSINASENYSDSEYIDTLIIHCKICNKDYEFEVLIN